MRLATSEPKAPDVHIHTKAPTSTVKLSPPNANVFAQAPSEALRPFVKRFVIVEFPFDRKLKLLPDTSFVAEFRFRGNGVFDGRANLPRAAISGLWDTARTRLYQGGTAIMLVMFTESGALAFLRDPLDTLFNTTAPLEHVLNRSELGQFDEQLVAAENNGQRIQLVESFLLEHIRQNRLDPFVSAALARIEET